MKVIAHYKRVLSINREHGNKSDFRDSYSSKETHELQNTGLNDHDKGKNRHVPATIKSHIFASAEIIGVMTGTWGILSESTRLNSSPLQVKQVNMAPILFHSQPLSPTSRPSC